jgi:hypothetical protein
VPNWCESVIRLAKQGGDFGAIVNRESHEVAAPFQIREESGGILMKMKERLRSAIENAATFFLQAVDSAQLREQRFQRIEGASSRMLH